MSDIVIAADSIRSPEMRHEVPLPVPDPFVYIERDGKRYVLVSSFEAPRIQERAPEIEVLLPEEFGLDDLVEQGYREWRLECELALRGCKHVGLERAAVPPTFPSMLLDYLREHGIAVTPDEELFTQRRRVKTAAGHEIGHGEIKPGEPVVLDLFPRDRETGCYADMTRPFVVGEPSDELREYHRLVKEALERSTAGVRAGVSGRTLFEQVCELFQAHGYKTQLSKDPGEVLADGFFHSLGHGVGLEVHEQPGLGRTGVDLVAGDVITLEPGLYRRGYGGLRLQELLLLTGDGAGRPTDYPYYFS